MLQFLLLGFVLAFNSQLYAKLVFISANSTLTLSGTSSQLILRDSINDYSGVLNITDKRSDSIVKNSSDYSINFIDAGKIIYGGISSSSVNLGSFSPGLGLVLNGGKNFYFENKVVNDPIYVSGIDNIISGAPFLSQPIVLQDCNTTLTLAITTKVGNNIVMNGGSLYLQNDLLLRDDCHITGSGTVYFNGYSLVYPVYNTPIASDLTYIDANDITVNTRTNQITNSNFTGTTNIRGNNVIMDFTGGGRYTFAASSTTYINGIHFKGLGSVGGGNLILGAGANVYLTECVLELSGTYTQTNGKITIEGGVCKVITNTGSSYVVSGASTNLTINGQELIYENSNQLPTYPFKTISGGTITTINNGAIVSNFIPGSANNTVLYANSAVGAVNSTDSNVDLCSGQSLTFYNENPTAAKSMIFDGNYNTVRFAEGLAQSFIVQPYISLTIRNVKFENFDPSKFLLMGAGASLAKIIFADNVTFDICKDLSLSTGALTLTGNTTITGNKNSTLTLASQSITFTGASKLLTICGTKLKYAAYDALKCTSFTSTVAFQASEIYMTNTGITVDAGYVKIKDYVQLRGVSETLAEATIPFTFSSRGLFTIDSGAIFEMDLDCGFNCYPDVSQDFGTASIQKRHFVMTDTSSMLILNKATLNTGPFGMALDDGKVVVNDNVTCNTSFTVGSEFELGSNVNLTILRSGNFNVNGAMKYVAS